MSQWKPETWNISYFALLQSNFCYLNRNKESPDFRMDWLFIEIIAVGKHFENYGTFFWNAIWKQRRGGQRRNWSENNLHFQSREPRGVQQVHQAWGALGRGAKLWPCGAFRHEICPKFYTAGISGQKFYTAKIRILDIVQSRLKSVNALNISNLGIFSTVLAIKTSVLIMPGNSCFTEKFTKLAKNLSCYRQCRQWQISPLCGYRNKN